MTTPAAAALYEAQHIATYAGKKVAVYNPNNLPVEQLPVVYGFNNGGSDYWYHGVLLAEDGICLGGHACSTESYMWSDLGILEETRPDRHEDFQKHYPEGYRMEFVGYSDVHKHEKLMKAISLANEIYKCYEEE